jgi:hypothetical protein
MNCWKLSKLAPPHSTTSTAVRTAPTQGDTASNQEVGELRVAELHTPLDVMDPHRNPLPMEGKVVKPDGVPSTAFVNVQEMMHVL